MLSALEIRRKTIHLLGGIVYIILIYFNILDVVVAGVLLVIYALTSWILMKYKVPFIRNIVKKFDRKRPKNIPDIVPITEIATNSVEKILKILNLLLPIDLNIPV